MIGKDEFCKNVRLCDSAMYYLALSIVKNEFDAGEVISEAIYRAYKNLDTLKNERSFKSWILRIVHNTAVEMIRRNSKDLPISEAMEIPDGKEGYETEIDTKLTLSSAVASLKQPYRTTVVLYYYEDLSASKIAQIMGTNAVTVKKRLSRARNMLREILKEDFER